MESFVHERRSGFLVFFANLANVFLVVLAANVVISLADDLVLLTPNSSTFYSFRGTLASLTLALTVAVLFLVIFVPQLPKLVLVPPIAVEFWLLFGAAPLSWSPTDKSTWVSLDLIQLAVCAFAFGVLRVTSGYWFLAASRLPRKSHLLLRALIAIPISLVVISVFAVTGLVGATAVFVVDQTKGYLQFAADGVEVRETVMRKGDKTVHLIATVHLADPAFYREVYATIPNDALILAEGVTDREGRLKSDLSYGRVAQTLGLETQDVFERLINPTVNAPDAGKASGGAKTPSASDAPTPPSKRPVVVRADVDISDLSDSTIRFIGRVGEIYGSRTFGEVIGKLSAISTEFTDAQMKSVMEDLVQKRNSKVLAEFDKRLPDFGTIVIPWGAQHMPGLEAAMKSRGFTIQSQRMIPLARYQTILNGLLSSTGAEAGRASGNSRFAEAGMARPRGVEPLLQE